MDKFSGNFWNIESFYNETNDANLFPHDTGVFVLIDNTWVKIEESEVFRAIAHRSEHSYSIRIYTWEIMNDLDLPPETQVMMVGLNDGAWLP